MNAVSAKMGGASTYLRGLVRECARLTEHEFIWYVPPGAGEVFRNCPAHFSIVTTSAGSLRTLRRLYWDQVTFRKIVRETSPDLVFSTGNFAVLSCPARQVLLVTQSVPFCAVWLKEVFPRKPLLSRLETRLRRWLICLSAKRADVVMTPTRAMLEDLGRFVALDARRTLVNPFGVEPPSSCLAPAPCQETLIGADPSGAVRLSYVSLYAEHKNLNTLLKAMPVLNRSPARRFFLKTTANPGWEGAKWACTHEEDLALAAKPGVAQWVQFVGPFGGRRTRAIYRGSDIFVFPSIAESFGLPLAEAMSFGLPVVAADTPVNREICCEAAVYFRPMDADDLAEAVRRVSEDASLRERLGCEGRRIARERFRWDEHVRRILAVAESASGGERCCAA